MPDSRISGFQQNAEKSLAHLKSEFSRLQTGRANPALVEHVDVEAYGQRQPLKNLAGIGIQDARTITVQPWDRSVMQAVEKALQMADLGASPVNNGTLILISLPPMSEERRQHLKKVVGQLAEEAKISIRKHRQEAQDSVKTEKDENLKKSLQNDLQKAVDDANAKIVDTAKKKEEEIMKI